MKFLKLMTRDVIHPCISLKTFKFKKMVQDKFLFSNLAGLNQLIVEH
jgi:hypothetical protein